MGLFSSIFGDDPEPPCTVSDEDYASLQNRARKANPRRDSISDPEAVRHRKAASLQHDQRHLS